MDSQLFFQAYSIIVSAISVCLCVIVIGISLRLHRNNRKSEYSWVLGFNAAIDLIYVVVTGIVMPCHLITSDHYYLLLSNSFLQSLSPFHTELLIVFAMFVLCIVTPSNTVHFWYRSNIICDGNVWGKRRYLLMYSAFVSYCVAQSCVLYSNTNHQNVESDMDILNSAELGLNVTKISRHAVYYLKSPFFIFGAVINQVSQTIQYGILFYFGWKIIKRLRENTMSSKSKRVQQHVVKVMILQAVYPLILMVVPLVASSLFILFKVPFPSVYLVSESVILMPILSCVTVLTMIPSYRRMVLKTIDLSLRTTVQEISRSDDRSTTRTNKFSLS